MPDTPEAILAELLPFLSHVYPIFEAAVSEATFDEFTSKGETVIEGCHHSSAIRIRVRRALVEKPDGLEYEIEPLNFNGLEVYHQGYDVKFYKAVNGHPPACGTSDARRDFYQQPLFGEDDDGILNQRLVVIYRVASDGSFLGMDLACPKDVVSDFAPPELHWSITVPHPGTLLNAAHRYEAPPDELDEITATDEDETDLDITRDGTDDTE
jgi:hypothetical protein